MKDYTNLSQTQADLGYDAGLRQHMIKVFNYMTLGLGVSGAFAYLAVTVPAFAAFSYQLRWVWFAGILAMAFLVMPRMYSMSENGAKLSFFGYAAILSISIAPMFTMYTGESIARTFFITASVFASMSLYGYTTKKDLTSFGTFAMIGIWGVFFASLVNIFIGSSTIMFVTSAIAVVASIALTAYDVQKIKHVYYSVGGGENAGRSAIIGALQLYFDFIYMFINLLQLMGDRKN